MSRNRLRLLVLGLIAGGLIIAAFYGYRTFNAYREVRGHRPPPDTLLEPQPRETDVELIREWMTIPYIAGMYRVPPAVLYKALDIPPGGNHDKSLRQLNEDYFPEAKGLAEVKIKAGILEYQAQHNQDANAISPLPPGQTSEPILP